MICKRTLVELYLHSLNTSSWRSAYLSTGTTLPLPYFVQVYKINARQEGRVICHTTDFSEISYGGEA
jgi:hypothetical protein